MADRDNPFAHSLANRFLGKEPQFKEPCEYYFIAYRSSTGLVTQRKNKDGWTFRDGKNWLHAFFDHSVSFPNVLTCGDLHSRYAAELRSFVENRFDKQRIAFFMGEDPNWKYDRWAIVYPGLRLHSNLDDESRLNDYMQQWREFEKAGTDAAASYPLDVGGTQFVDWMMHLCRTFQEQILLRSISDMVNGTLNADREFPAERRPGTGFIKLINLRKLSARAVLGDVSPLPESPRVAAARESERAKLLVKRGGRPPLALNKSTEAQARLNVYQLIRMTKEESGISGPKSLKNYFKDNKDFQDLVKAAGLKPDAKMFRAAEKWISENPVHETHSRKVS